MEITRQQFEALALEQIDMLHRLARRLTRDSSRAEDLVQETYLRAVRSWKTFDLRAGGIRPWLARILHNLHYSKAQRDMRQPRPTDSEVLEAIGPTTSTPLPIDPTSLESMDQKLAAGIRDLPSEYSAPLLLWAVEGFSYLEIAKALNIPMGTVMSRLHRARQRLSDQLHDLGVEQRLIRE